MLLGKVLWYKCHVYLVHVLEFGSTGKTKELLCDVL